MKREGCTVDLGKRRKGDVKGNEGIRDGWNKRKRMVGNFGIKKDARNEE